MCHRRSIRQVTSYTALRQIKCSSCLQISITAVTSNIIHASFPTHNFENFVGDLYVLISYEPKIPIPYLIYRWKSTGVNNTDLLNLAASVEF